MSTLSVANLSDLSGGTNINIGGGTPEKLVLMTAQATTSGTVIDFTGIPSWAKRITVMFNGVSTSGTSAIRIQIGTSGGIESSGYNGTCTQLGAAASTAASSAGFDSNNDTIASLTRHGSLFFVLAGSNTWALSGAYGVAPTANNYIFAGTKTLSGTLDRVRITTVNGTDTFDAGSINILYEG